MVTDLSQDVYGTQGPIFCAESPRILVKRFFLGHAPGPAHLLQYSRFLASKSHQDIAQQCTASQNTETAESTRAERREREQKLRLLQALDISQCRQCSANRTSRLYPGQQVPSE